MSDKTLREAIRRSVAHAEPKKDLIGRIEELEANINIKADFIDATINQLAASDQRIEELEAKRDEALNQLDSARHSVAVLEKRVKTFCDGWGVADKGRLEAEAKLAMAVEALEFYATQDVTYPNVGTVTFHGHDDNGRKARTTLAELSGVSCANLKGQNDE